MMKIFIFLNLFFVFNIGAQGLSPIIIPGNSPAESNQSALFKLKSLLLDARYLACKESLIQFLNVLNTADEKELSRQERSFDGARLKDLIDTKRKEMKYATDSSSSPVTINKNMQSAHFLISYKKFKCQISIYPSLGEDSIKASLDPSSSDVQIKSGDKSFDMAATLLGVSANPTKNADVHYDPSKVLTILNSFEIRDTRQQVKILDDFQAWQLRQRTQSISTPPPK